MTKKGPKPNDEWRPSLPGDGCEDEVQLLRLTPQEARLVLRHLLGGGDHPKPVFRLAGFLLAGADLAAKLLLGNGVVRLTVVRADAGACPNDLTDQRQGDNILGDLLGKGKDGLAEARGALLQVILP